MSIVVSNWSHVLSIPESYTPSENTSGQTLLIDQTTVEKLSQADQDTFWNSVQNGGGDIRVCGNSDGTSQYPVEVTSLNTTTKQFKLRIRKPVYNGSETIHVFVGKPAEVQPSITDPFGRNAVWQDDTHRQGGDGATDVTGTTTILLNNQAVQQGTVNGFNAVKFNATEATCAVFENTSGENWTADFTLSAWVKADALANGFANIIGSRTNSAWEFSFRLESTQPAMLIGSSSPNSSANLSVNTDYLLHATVSGNTLRFYLNGSPIGVQTVSGSRANRADELTFGGILHPGADGTGFNGFVAEARASNGSVASPAKILTEYQNQKFQSSFFGTPTLSATGDTGGSGTVQPLILEVGQEAQAANTSLLTEALSINLMSASAVNAADLLLIESVSSVQVNQAQQFNEFELMLTNMSSAVQARQGQQVSDANTGLVHQFLSLSSLQSYQVEDAISENVLTNLELSLLDASEGHSANTLDLNQSAGQLVNLITANQSESSNLVSIEQVLNLSSLVTNQISQADLFDIRELHILNLIVANEEQLAQNLTIEQYSGQLISLISASQTEQTELVFVSVVNNLESVICNHTNEAESLDLSGSNLIEILNAEELSEARILNIISAGDNTNLSNLRLVPVGSTFKLIPVNEKYTLEKT